MNHLITLIIASLIGMSMQGFTGAPIQWMSRVVMPKSPAIVLPSSSAPELLLIRDPPQKTSRSNVPYFAFNSDGTIVWEGTDRCIEAAGGKSGDAVYLNRCTGEPAQTWNWIPNSHGGNFIQLKDTDKCLDASVEGGFDGVPIVMWECESKGAGAWKFEEPAPLSAPGRFMVMYLITLAGAATLSLGAFLRLYTGSRKLTLAQRGATSTLDVGGVSLNSPLAVQMTASPIGGNIIQRSGNVRMSDVGTKRDRRSGDIFMREVFEDYMKKRQAAERSGPVQGNQATGEEEAVPAFVKDFYTQATPPETAGFIMQQTMVRITDPQESLNFYCNVLGMRLIWDVHFPAWGFSIYFVGYCDKEIPQGPENDLARRTLAMTTKGTVELTHNHGDKGPLHTGNTTSAHGMTVKGGFGHIGVTVPGDSVYEVCQRFKDLGVEFQKSPNSGGMKGIAFVKDPDGYWIEILPQGSTWKTEQVDCCGVRLDGGGGYTGGGSKL